ncbi:MAG TPA: decaprenyl-phosphate phosphoribosyltransferase [Gemmatimonadales bacterium]
MSEVTTVDASLRDWIRLIRPQQWIKNAFVLTPLLFSGKFLALTADLRAGLAFISFCFLASAVYAWNDILDREGDRQHPTKRLRPVAAGRISVSTAAWSGVVLAAIGLAGCAVLGKSVLVVAVAYLGLNVLYSFRLKHVVVLDVFCVAGFFVLRLLAGARAVAVVPSIWLLLCGGLLALYLGFAKRRHELVLLGSGSSQHRTVLADYSPAFLDQMSGVLLSVTIVAYIMYTLSPEKLAEIGSYRLTYSTGFVLYGVFRYLFLVHQREGGNPNDVLFTDRALLASVVLWFLYCFWVIYSPR